MRYIVTGGASPRRRLIDNLATGVVDGRNVVDPDAWVEAGFAYRGIGRGDKNGHALKE